jgi:hypothetical protein|tara:strand:+ start:97 stop:603 length:507 start_codon:yes stop_codon:yes gene_type:complete
MPIVATMEEEIPADLADAAAERDLLVDEVADSLIPAAATPYNAKALEALAGAVQSIASLMGIEIEIAAYDGPAVELDPDIQRFLLMMDAAARDYGKPFPVALEELRSDKELTAITAHLTALAEDAAFAEFLSAEEEEPFPDLTVEVDVEAPVEEIDEEEEDAFFASRV